MGKKYATNVISSFVNVISNYAPKKVVFNNVNAIA